MHYTFCQVKPGTGCPVAFTFRINLQQILHCLRNFKKIVFRINKSFLKSKGWHNSYRPIQWRKSYKWQNNLISFDNVYIRGNKVCLRRGMLYIDNIIWFHIRSLWGFKMYNVFHLFFRRIKWKLYISST